jgi:hypothetical protein
MAGFGFDFLTSTAPQSAVRYPTMVINGVTYNYTVASQGGHTSGAMAGWNSPTGVGWKSAKNQSGVYLSQSYQTPTYVEFVRIENLTDASIGEDFVFNYKLNKNDPSYSVAKPILFWVNGSIRYYKFPLKIDVIESESSL